jgi:ABC-type dipeptide/oligopeptide/nickel transport system permease subunit
MSELPPSDRPDPVAHPLGGEPANPATTTLDPPPGEAGRSVEREFTVRARTQRDLVMRRFFRHRGALAGMAVFLFTVLLAFSSIGTEAFPGWWNKSYSSTAEVERPLGHPTMEFNPFDGDGVRFGSHPFGQDNVGRDYFAVTMRGAQRSLTIAIIVGLVSLIIGVTVGALAGYFRGAVESILMRLTDLVITIPLLLLAAVIGQAVNGLGAVTLALFLGLLVWVSLARLVRGEFLSLREKEFVEAARAMGASSGRIIFRHILPNTMGTIIVNATLTVSAAVLLETAISFLGFGVQPPDTSLGVIISTYEDAFQTRPWLFWWPGLFIIAIALSVNFIGDGLRDAFDPRQTRVRA